MLWRILSPRKIENVKENILCIYILNYCNYSNDMFYIYTQDFYRIF